MTFSGTADKAYSMYNEARILLVPLSGNKSTEFAQIDEFHYQAFACFSAISREKTGLGRNLHTYNVARQWRRAYRIMTSRMAGY